MSRTLKTLIVAAGRLSSMLLLLGLAGALSRMLPKEQYGAFQKVLLIHMYGAIALVVGLPQTVVYFFPRYKGIERTTLVGSTITMLATSGAILGLGLYFGADLIGRFMNSPLLPDLLRAYAPIPMFMFPIYAMTPTMISANKVVTAVIFEVTLRAGMLLSVVLPVAAGLSVRDGVSAWSLTTAVGGITAAALMLRTAGPMGLSGRWKSIAVSQLKYALPLAGATVMGALAGVSDKVIISNIFGDSIYAGYANGAMELPIVSIIGVSASTVLFPELVRLVKENRTRDVTALWHNSIRRINVIVLPFLGLLCFMAPDAMAVLYGPKYIESAVFFRIYLLVLPVRVVLYGSLALSFGATRLFALCQTLAAVTSVTLGLVLIKVFNTPAVASIAAVTAVYVGFSTAAWGLSSRMGIRFIQFLPLGNTIRVTLVSLACGLLAWTVTLTMTGTSFWSAFLRLAVASLVFTACYVPLTTVLRLADWKATLQALLRRGPSGPAPQSQPASPVTDDNPQSID